MSCQAKDLGLRGEAVRLAEAARSGYPGASPRVSAILHMRAAQAHAQASNTYETRAAMDAAAEALDATPPETGDPQWSYWLDARQMNEQAGYCFARLEDWER